MKLDYEKKGEDYQVTIDPVKLQEEIDRLYAAIKVHHEESQMLHRQLAEAEALQLTIGVVQ